VAAVNGQGKSNTCHYSKPEKHYYAMCWNGIVLNGTGRPYFMSEVLA
jgi:hypothetical protein